MSHIVLRTPDGVMLTMLEGVVSWDFARTFNDIGWFNVVMEDLDPRFLAVDNLLEFYRTPVGVSPILLGVGFLRSWEWAENERGASSLTLKGPDQIDLLNRRVVAYTDPEARWNKSGFADDLMKEVVSENMGPTSTDPWYNRGRQYDPVYFSIAPDEGKGKSIVLEFQFRNVLAVLQDMASASAWPSEGDDWESLTVFFDCDYVAPGAFVFRTWSPLRGVDRTIGSQIAPLIFSREAGNIANPSLRFDYSEEENIVYGLGQGDGEDRMVDPENDVPRERLSIWNIREGIAPATEEATIQGVAWRAYVRMQEQRPQIVFQGDLLDTPQSRFGVEWGFGDLVTVRYRGFEFDGRVDTFVLACDASGGERLTAAVTITKAIEGKPT